jgi:hypothetical protein
MLAMKRVPELLKALKIEVDRRVRAIQNSPEEMSYLDGDLQNGGVRDGCFDRLR